MASEAAKSLGKTWRFGDDREHPDFIVFDGTEQFGLEVSEIFIGPQGHAGSALKQRESRTQQTVNELRLQYEAAANIPLNVRFVGKLDAENIVLMIPELIASNLPSKPIGHQLVIDTGMGLRVHVTKSFRPDWYSINERVGFVDRNPQKTIADAIEKKSKELSRYVEETGPDVRLLLVADRIHNSGKMTLEKPSPIAEALFDRMFGRFMWSDHSGCPECAIHIGPVRAEHYKNSLRVGGKIPSTARQRNVGAAPSPIAEI